MADPIVPPPLASRLVRTLDLEGELHGEAFLSAASGVAIIGQDVVVAADDAHHLAVFPRSSDAPGRLFRVIEGGLPADPAARKKHKPDFEALVVVPGGAATGGDVLLVIGSGSTDRRDTAALVELEADGSLSSRVQLRSLAPLYSALRDHCGEINIEAAFVDHEALVLVSRANGGSPENHVARFGLDALAPWLEAGETRPVRPTAVSLLDVGRMDGVPLGVTDATPSPDGGWLFSAVAENTADSYNDGPTVGAVVGAVDAAGAVVVTVRLDRTVKIEGIAAEPTTGGVVLTLVTDADDPTEPAMMLQADLRKS